MEQPSTTGLTAGLTKASAAREPLPGEAYIIRFKNPCRNYRTDLWIGIITTEEFGPCKKLHGRATGAKNSDGSWDSSPCDRVYPVYMPGRNSYPRDDASLFRQLQKIALKDPGSRFWEDMAEKEMAEKGKRSRLLSLVLPDSYENILVGIEELPEASLPARAMVQSSLETGPGNLPCPAAALTDNHVPDFSQSHQGVKVKCEDDSDHGKTSTGVLEMSLQVAIESLILGKPEAGEIQAFLEHMSELRSQPEFILLKSWCLTKEFQPRLIQINSPGEEMRDERSSEDTARSEIGDIRNIGRQWQLQDIRTSDDLRETIRSLGNLYVYARRLNLDEMIRNITLKLQVAWNSYPGLCQLEPILDVTAIVYKSYCPSTAKDHLQEWLPRFVAEVQDLMLLACSPKFQSVMRDSPSLYHDVSDLRVKFVLQSPTKYTDARLLLESRGIDRLCGVECLV
ncbi:hypothetical protein N7466_008810 [Penicillium verhagenii]|uniref:uncharacterized protein n=1 Tax=Penicillium verhagenii TaxID=1562060 RepID=UPI002545132D|nr:uncharacterized protein N7466_008810 [Penicillium verhagenii]KAJ5924623.1 hypothetical protein N7466_008810 [Penicillium verhagenii]